MKVKCFCGCGKEFEPTPKQLGQLRRGNNVYYSKECGDIARKAQRRERYLRDKRVRDESRRRGAEYRERQREYKAKQARDRNKKMTAAREKASLYCTRYDECLNKLFKQRNGQFQCHKCDKMVKGYNIKSLDLSARHDGPFPLKLPN